MTTADDPSIIPAMALAAEPVAPSERLAVLDILRGFAILGIVMVHFGQFNPNWAPTSSTPP